MKRNTRTTQRAAEFALSRRSFLKVAGASALFGACADDAPYFDPNFDPTGAPDRYQGYAGLADLPFFRLDDNGRLINVVRGMPPAIDFHAHLGFGTEALTGRSVDLTVETDDIEYLIDCDADPECEMQLDVYLNVIGNEAVIAGLETQLITSGLTGRGSIRTHTAPNLVRELDEMGFDRAVLLPISLGEIAESLDVDQMAEWWANSVDRANLNNRLVMWGSVHPTNADWPDRLQMFADRGYQGIKFHPTIGSIAPDDPLSMEVFEECSRLGLHVFFHSGRAGIEPERTQGFALMERYVAPLEEFPDVQFIFGHSGARMDARAALDLAKQHDNVWMELAGPSMSTMQDLLDEFDNDRILFGSDWPFYPLAATLAKVLLLTYGDRGLRDAIIANNARALLGLS